MCLSSAIAAIDLVRSGDESVTSASLEGESNSAVMETATRQRATSAAVRDQTCDLAAAPALPKDLDPRAADAMRTNLASQSNPPVALMSREQALAMARDLSSIAQEALALSEVSTDAATLPAAAVQVPYRVANAWLGGAETDRGLVAPTRCVWVVTVEGPFRPRSVPPGSKPTTYSSYTAVFDSRSGQYLAVTAGVDSPNVISGQNL